MCSIRDRLDLDKEGVPALIQTLGLKEILDSLRAANDEYAKLTAQRTGNRAASIKEASAVVRLSLIHISIDFNGNTGPFIQYTYARIRSVLRKAAEQGITLPEQLPLTFAISEKEENLIQMIADYAEIVKEAGKLYSPACVANYIYDLVKEYNQFYHDFPILREENPELKNFRLVLSANVAKIVKSGMDLLGIEVPERM